MSKPRPPRAPVPASEGELLIAALRHANEVSALLNDLGAEVSRLAELPVSKRRLERLQNLLRRRFLDNSGVHLFIAADNLRLELPEDLRDDRDVEADGYIDDREDGALA